MSDDLPSHPYLVENARLRAAIDAQKAEQKYLMGLAAADAESLRADLAEAERGGECSHCRGAKPDCLQCGGSGKEIDRLVREVNAKSAFELSLGGRIAQLEADLATAREIIMDYYASGFCPEHVMDKPCAKDCTLARTSAFLERTATRSQT